jgi:hypothetical protein
MEYVQDESYMKTVRRSIKGTVFPLASYDPIWKASPSTQSVNLTDAYPVHVVRCQASGACTVTPVFAVTLQLLELPAAFSSDIENEAGRTYGLNSNAYSAFSWSFANL